MSGTARGPSRPVPPTARRRHLLVTGLAALVVLLLAACAPGMNDAVGTAADSGTVAGFWHGLWHGFISPVTFVVSLFTETVGIYEIHNNGGWYDFGFMVGVSIFFGGGAGGSRGASRARSGR